jgi:hypothetical protein
MRKLLFLLIAALAMYSLSAQNDSAFVHRKSVPNIAILKTVDHKSLKGWFYQMNDSQIVLLDRGTQYWKMQDNASAQKNYLTYTTQIEQVQSLKLRKKNSVKKGLLIGLGGGILTGVLIGFISGDDPVTPYTGTIADPFIAFGNAFAMTAGEKALIGASGLGTLGALTGIIIGAVAKKKFNIGGSRKRVRDLDVELRQRLFIQ